MDRHAEFASTSRPFPPRASVWRQHPPYGLFLDPHGDRHNWSLVGLRTLLRIATGAGVLVVLVNVLAR